jgi:enoyl-CoA hydratase
MPVHVIAHEEVAVLTLELGRGNAIDDAFIDHLHAALGAVLAGPARALVLTGSGRTFSGGLDLLAAWELDRPRLELFVDRFEALFERVLILPLPVVAAVNGHAIAGGAILAMACDVRVLTPGPFGFAVNEVLLGIPFPSVAFEIARRAVPASARAEAFLEGRRFSPEEAVARGLAQALASERGALADAVDKARALCRAPREILAAVKAELLAPTLARIEASRAARRARFVEAWLAPEARARMGALRAELLAKRK